MEHPIKFKITKEGKVMEVFHPNDAGQPPVILGRVTEEARGGHVLPAQPLKRAAFRLLRRIFGGNSPIASWTRRWGGKWIIVEASTGKRLPGVFENHTAAVQAEVAWMLKTL